ncbi:MAG TPA: hypothetical protein PLG34_10020 [Spirochaetota bacterium]|mgnify:FL=1|nr:MAG: hypothetical protein BWX91_02035 [Spirochaetes bacterium ADurb.Bin133]HNZ26787.1 hypothetical protein [Spirochaetota bacterium]HPY88307.1 hypothetical protein [Spirochaetota bacterium]HQB60449.1 hypothetical protein [Spirochaetota bacterium]
MFRSSDKINVLNLMDGAVIKKIFVIIILSASVSYISADDLSEDYSIGDKFYSRQNFYISSSFETGLSGTKDYLSEKTLFIYKFRSLGKFQFGIRTNHVGFAVGAYSGRNYGFNFLFAVGFEFLYKVFNNRDGLLISTDMGWSNKGYAFFFSIGLGSRMRNYIELNFLFGVNLAVMSNLNFSVVIYKILSLKGVIGVDIFYKNNWQIDVFLLKFGLFLPLTIREIFRIEFGGGLTLNDYYIPRGYGGITLSFSI